jgi:hypothetical protein
VIVAKGFVVSELTETTGLISIPAFAEQGRNRIATMAVKNLDMVCDLACNFKV